MLNFVKKNFKKININYEFKNEIIKLLLLLINLPSFNETIYCFNLSLINSFPFVCRKCFTASPSSVLSSKVISIYKSNNYN